MYQISLNKVFSVPTDNNVGNNMVDANSYAFIGEIGNSHVNPSSQNKHLNNIPQAKKQVDIKQSVNRAKRYEPELHKVYNENSLLKSEQVDQYNENDQVNPDVKPDLPNNNIFEEIAVIQNKATTSFIEGIWSSLKKLFSSPSPKNEMLNAAKERHLSGGISKKTI